MSIFGYLVEKNQNYRIAMAKCSVLVMLKLKKRVGL